MFLVYIIKVAVLQTVFYLTYKLLLSRESFHRFNRAVLLLMQAASLLLPLVHVSVDEPSVAGRAVAAAEYVIVQTTAAEPATAEALTPVQVLTIVYLAGVVLLLLRTAVSMARLLKLVYGGRRCMVDGVGLTVVPADVSPFSWFGHIVVSESDYAQGIREILIHERAHARRMHSFDILLSNAVIALTWFSPCAWLLRSELRDVHEYEADDQVLRSGVDATHYQLLLIRKAVGERLFAMANNLNQTNLKKRMTMMKMKKSNPWNRAKAALALPLAAMAVVAFATPKTEQARMENQMGSKNSVSQTDSTCVVIDGKVVEGDVMNKINAEKIKSVYVVKGKEALKMVDEYGEKAKNGVVIINTKTSDSDADDSKDDKPAIVISTVKVDGETGDSKTSVLKLKGKLDYSVAADEQNFTYEIDGKTATEDEVKTLDTKKIKAVTVKNDANSSHVSVTTK